MQEETPLIKKQECTKLSLILTIICIIDVFGVFPVIALPKAIIDCGFYGILIIITVCTTQIYTAILLGRSWMIAEEIEPGIAQKYRYPYSALTEFVFGPTPANFVSILLNITVFSGGVPNLILASQNIQLLGLRISDNAFNVSFCYWIIIIGIVLCPILWLGSPKDMKILCTISMVMVVLVFLLVAGCLAFSSIPEMVPEENVPERSLWELIFTAYGIIAFQYDIHPSILTIQVDMKEKSKLALAIIAGFTASLAMFAVVAAIASARFGVATQPSILETLPTSAPLHFAAFFVAVQLCLTSAISNSALYQYMEDCMQISRDFNQRRCILRTMLTCFAILIAESVPRFDLVMSLIGGTLTAPIVFMLPPLIYLNVLRKKRKFVEEMVAMESLHHSESGQEKSWNFMQKFDAKSRRWEIIEAVFCVIIVVVSGCCTILTTYVNVKNSIGFVQFTQPCIYNVSRALLEL